MFNLASTRTLQTIERFQLEGTSGVHQVNHLLESKHTQHPTRFSLYIDIRIKMFWCRFLFMFDFSEHVLIYILLHIWSFV